MWFTDFVSPIATTNWDNWQFSQNDCSTDGCSNFFTAFNSQTNMSIAVSDSDECLEACTLTSTCLFLDRHDLQDFITQWASQEEINDFELFDWQWVEINLFQWADLSVTDQTSQFSDWNPFFLISFFVTTTSAASTSTAATSSSTC